ncbi:hypothetical protein F4803DRAFT_496097 [Xylaria telfairii]|nr:hypothetical protein F4803DRAFT_496097 [Xylaria telfairii]
MATWKEATIKFAALLRHHVETLDAHVTPLFHSLTIGVVSRLDEPHRLALRGIVPGAGGLGCVPDITYDSIFRAGPAFFMVSAFCPSSYLIALLFLEPCLLSCP